MGSGVPLEGSGLRRAAEKAAKAMVLRRPGALRDVAETLDTPPTDAGLSVWFLV